jgi:hypothetical protein
LHEYALAPHPIATFSFLPPTPASIAGFCFVSRDYHDKGLSHTCTIYLLNTSIAHDITAVNIKRTVVVQGSGALMRQWLQHVIPPTPHFSQPRLCAIASSLISLSLLTRKD